MKTIEVRSDLDRRLGRMSEPEGVTDRDHYRRLGMIVSPFLHTWEFGLGFHVWTPDESPDDSGWSGREWVHSGSDRRMFYY